MAEALEVVELEDAIVVNELVDDASCGVEEVLEVELAAV